MSLDHEDIQRMETIEEIIKKLLEEVNRLHNRICDVEKAIITIEERLSIMDEVKKEKIKDLDQQIDSMIGQLPVGFRGMMKKIVNKGDEKNE